MIATVIKIEQEQIIEMKKETADLNEIMLRILEKEGDEY